MATKNVVLPIPLAKINSPDVTGTYQLLSAVTGLPAACIILRFINNSTADITISYDGVYDHEYLQAATRVTLNFQTNNQPSASVSCMAVGTKIYIKGTAGTGDIYLAGYYNPQGI